MTGSALVNIKLQDVDDNMAVLTEASYQFRVDENSPVGLVVGTVTARDNDLAPYNTVYYRLLDDHSDSFIIDPLNGQYDLDLGARVLDLE